MKIFPHYECELKYNLTPEEFIQILRDNMNHIDMKSHKVLNRHKLFTGSINGMNFSMKHEIEGMNSGNPEINGFVKRNDNGCTVEIKFSLFLEVKIVMILMYMLILLFVSITFIIFIYALFHNRLNFMFLGPLLLLIINHQFIRVLMDGQITYAIEDLKEIVHSYED